MSVMSYGILNDYLASNDLRSLVYSCDSPGQQRTRSRSTNFTGNSVETFRFESFWNIYDGHRSGRAWNMPLLTIKMKHVAIILIIVRVSGRKDCGVYVFILLVMYRKSVEGDFFTQSNKILRK